MLHLDNARSNWSAQFSVQSCQFNVQKIQDDEYYYKIKLSTEFIDAYK